MSTKSCADWHGEPSMAKKSSPSRAPKTGDQLRDNPEEREKCVKTAENHSHRHMTASRNNVQIFKCELRKEVRVHRHDENM